MHLLLVVVVEFTISEIQASHQLPTLSLCKTDPEFWD